ncbi:MAG TPA: hypothetical protein PLI09_28950 [Candidatus Hydrogenedentes bacterium]|nr:hypothetical protein [Candidatus Hydrogenedentota bacterium]
MNNPKDWLEETWEIKHKLADRFKKSSYSEQVLKMREMVREEWKRQGWVYVETTPGSNSRASGQ